MNGKVLGIATAEAQDVITGEDGKRYRYAFGTWVLLAAGIALIAAGLGLVRNPLAKSQS